MLICDHFCLYENTNSVFRALKVNYTSDLILCDFFPQVSVDKQSLLTAINDSVDMATLFYAVSALTSLGLQCKHLVSSDSLTVTMLNATRCNKWISPSCVKFIFF